MIDKLTNTLEMKICFNGMLFSFFFASSCNNALMTQSKVITLALRPRFGHLCTRRCTDLKPGQPVVELFDELQHLSNALTASVCVLCVA